MANQGKYKVERKVVTVLPRMLSRWKVVGEDLDIGRVREFMKEDIHAELLQLEQRVGSTVLKFRYTPHWSAEEYERYRNMATATRLAFPSPEEHVFYRVSPRLGISFNDTF
ncbi:hypothetical protein HYV50_04560 [Candidatus Pacearchaeota archaeon]|nr:hypothetical protein [Candidatus Pacearchaeota archaeon]